jgi:hypothetical protein
MTDGDEHAYVHGFATQLFPAWLAVVILIALAFGLWQIHLHKEH